jgi:hypothetical protein
LIVHPTPSPHCRELFEAVVAGATYPEIEGVEVVRRPALTVSPVEPLEADDLMLGSPANLGYISGAASWCSTSRSSARRHGICSATSQGCFPAGWGFCGKIRQTVLEGTATLSWSAEGGRMQRWPVRYVIRLKDELNGVNGIIGVAGIIIGAFGFTTEGVIQVVVWAAGALIAVPPIGYALIKAIPPKRKPLSDFDGKQILMSDLASVDPPPPTLGVVGPVRVGKTTLLDTLLQRYDPEKDIRTKGVTVHIMYRPTGSWAVIDGRGEDYSQQFEVAKAAQVLCVLLDHNLVSEASGSNDDRIQKHKDFGVQLRAALNNEWQRNKPSHLIPVHLLLNKRDQWQAAGDEDKAALRKMLEHEKEEWEKLTFVDEVTTADHSNSLTGDTTKLLAALEHLRTTRRSA